MPRIDAKTQVCALFGYPVGHSRSPEIHNAAFDELNLPYVYVAHEVLPGQVGQALQGVRAMGYRGLSVTIPHKVEAMQGMDEVDGIAQGIGCINTVVNDAGRLKGYNSDGLGALNALRDAGVDPRGTRTVILGSGGAARAIAVTIASESPPTQITMLGVVPDELARLVDDVRQRNGPAIEGIALTPPALEAALADADLVLHCSPVGMHPHEDESLVPERLLRPDLAVFDAVYNPRRTKLLSEAARAGCRTIEGIEMFLGQAYVQFELWTGRKAPRDVMRRVLKEKL